MPGPDCEFLRTSVLSHSLGHIIVTCATQNVAVAQKWREKTCDLFSFYSLCLSPSFLSFFFTFNFCSLSLHIWPNWCYSRLNYAFLALNTLSLQDDMQLFKQGVRKLLHTVGRNSSMPKLVLSFISLSLVSFQNASPPHCKFEGKFPKIKPSDSY